MAATKSINASRHGQEVQLFFRLNVRMGNICYLICFDRGMIVDARHSISWDFHAQQSLEFAENGAINKIHPVSSSSVGRNTL